MRPQIKFGDKVRLRTDGEIGEFAKYMFPEFAGSRYVACNISEKTDLVSLQECDEFFNMVPQMLLEICNDFAEVEVGDEVEFMCDSGKTECCIVTEPGLRWGYIKEYFIRIVKKAEKPQPKFAGIQKGDFVEASDGSHRIIEGTLNSIFEANVPGHDYTYEYANNTFYTSFRKIDGICPQNKDIYITRILKPSEVVLDFGSGIKGRIVACGINWVSIIPIGSDISLACFCVDVLTEPMKSIVLDLIKRQEEE